MIYSEIYTNEKNIEFVNDEHGNAYRVFESKEFNNEKYIKVRNRLNTDDEQPFNELFSGRIKDAIETIRNGDADSILLTTRLFVNEIIDVAYFLNREFGEKIRKRTIDGWKNAEFGWIIKFGNRDSMGGLYTLNDKNDVYVYNDSPKVFNTRKEAENDIEKLKYTAKQYAEKYASLAQDKSKNVIEKLKADLVIEFYSKYKRNNIILDLVFDMLDDNLSVINNYNLTECIFKIEQYLKP